VPREVEIVGVVGDVRHFGLDREATLEVYVPIGQVPDATTIWLANNMYWVVHTTGDPLMSANAVRREIAAIDPTVPASFVRSMDQWLGGTLAARRFNLQVVAAFAGAALLLAIVGVYGVSAAAVTSRTRELGIRAAIASAHALSAMLFGVEPGDPLSIAAGAATLAAAALLANVVPALRAVRVDPIVALWME
jgi:putative ABC transport system permease protein